MKKTLLAVIIFVPATLLTGCVTETVGYSSNVYNSDYPYSGSSNLYSAGYGLGYSDYSLAGGGLYAGRYNRGWSGVGWRGAGWNGGWRNSGWRGRGIGWNGGGWRGGLGGWHGGGWHGRR